MLGTVRYAYGVATYITIFLLTHMFSEIFIHENFCMHLHYMKINCTKRTFSKIFEHENYPNYGTLVLGSGE